MCQNIFEYFLLEMHDKIIHSLKICLELRDHSVTPIQPCDYLLTPFFDGPIDSWVLILATLKTTALTT